jgi:hypothetical protein
MGIKMTTPIEEVEAYINSKIDESEEIIIRRLAYVGEQCVNEARTGKSYLDQTGNLCSSTGYVLIKDGEIIQMSDFKPVKDGAEGKKDGEAYVKELAGFQTAGKIKSGLVLIVVAGKNYAGYVANMGYNVLDSAELLAEKLVPQLLSELGFEKA